VFVIQKLRASRLLHLTSDPDPIFFKPTSCFNGLERQQISWGIPVFSGLCLPQQPSRDTNLAVA
jgi:hypothetical protein